MLEALQRGLALAEREADVAPQPLPSWVVCPVFAEAVATVALLPDEAEAVSTLVSRLRALERTARRALRAQLTGRSAGRIAARWEDVAVDDAACALPAHGASGPTAERGMAVAAARLAAGAAAEAALALAATAEAWCGRRATMQRTKVSAHERKAARLYADAHLVAVWTSAHASYVADVQLGIEEPTPPTLCSVPNASADWDWSALFERRWCPRQCSGAAKTALPLLNCFTRSTNPGARGWDSLLESALTDSTALRIVLSGAMTVSLVGLHPHVHPALRPPWWLRVRILHVLQTHMNFDVKTSLVEVASLTKEAVRRLLASTVAATPALHAALAKVGHPVGLLTTPPLRLPHRGMEGSAEAFVAAGEALAHAEAGASFPRRCATPLRATRCAAASGRPASPSAGTRRIWGRAPPRSTARCRSSTWRPRSSRPPSAPTSSPSGCTRCCTRCAACASTRRSTRASTRLNAATRLTRALGDAEALAVQRRALGDVSSGILTLAEVGERLGVAARGTSSNGGARGPEDALRALSADGARGAARLLAYARVAWLSEQVLIVDLGARTRGLQVQALFRRLGHPRAAQLAAMRPQDVPEAALLELPVHATHLQACVECKRFANAVVVDGGKPGQTFNELGVSIAMLCTECRGPCAGEVHIRCAKRSSAALRTAVQFEEEMGASCVEQHDGDAAAVAKLLRQPRGSGGGNADSGVAARVRRDAKNALEQRAAPTACGEQPMLSVPAVGRALRLWDVWYALCAYCGTFVKLQPHHRYGVEICCLRCDAQMLGVEPAAPEATESAPASQAVCRFCFKVQPSGSGARWKVVKAPLDTAGPNKTLPAPLKTVHYCPTHWRPWLTTAHRTLPTRVILSHLAHNAKPINGAEHARNGVLDLGFEEGEAPKKRKKRKVGKVKV